MPAAVSRKIMKHVPCGVVATPMSYRRHLNPGDEVKMLYDSLLLIVPKSGERVLMEKKELADELLRQSHPAIFDYEE